MQASNITRHVIRVSTLGWSIKPLWDFVQICHEYKVDTFKQTMTANFYCHGGLRGDWDPVTKAVRKLDTMDIDDDVKADLINDAEACKPDDTIRFEISAKTPYRLSGRLKEALRRLWHPIPLWLPVLWPARYRQDVFQRSSGRPFEM
jgi:hypothetical protein